VVDAGTGHLNLTTTRVVDVLGRTNYAGEAMLRVFQNGGQNWQTFYKYDSAGRIILKANPSAVTGYKL
jgi:hypothetical protein